MRHLEAAQYLSSSSVGNEWAAFTSTCVRGDDACEINEFGCVHRVCLKKGRRQEWEGSPACGRGGFEPRRAKWRGRVARATQTNKADHTHASENDERRRVATCVWLAVGEPSRARAAKRTTAAIARVMNGR